MSIDPGTRFPGESDEYRRERNRLLEVPILNVFVRDGDTIHHRWASELMFAPREEGLDPRHADSIWPIWNILDMTPEGRVGGWDFPRIDSG